MKSKEVDLGEEYGVVEFREPLFRDMAPNLDADPKDLGIRLLELCVYQDGKRLFAGEVGMGMGMALLKHINVAMEVCGMASEKKESATESE